MKDLKFTKYSAMKFADTFLFIYLFFQIRLDLLVLVANIYLLYCIHFFLLTDDVMKIIKLVITVTYCHYAMCIVLRDICTLGVCFVLTHRCGSSTGTLHSRSAKMLSRGDSMSCNNLSGSWGRSGSNSRGKSSRGCRGYTRRVSSCSARGTGMQKKT